MTNGMQFVLVLVFVAAAVVAHKISISSTTILAKYSKDIHNNNISLSLRKISIPISLFLSSLPYTRSLTLAISSLADVASMNFRGWLLKLYIG